MKTIKTVLAILLSAVFMFAALTPAFADDSKIIKEVRLTVTEPKVGDAPATEIISAEPEKYTVSIRYWLHQNVNDNSTVTQFQEGTYGVVFYVNAADGYKFDTVANNASDFPESAAVVYLNGEKTGCVSAETETRLARALNFEVKAEAEEYSGNFFTNIINAIKAFFESIANFFRGLFN